jgi:hypothetical protein
MRPEFEQLLRNLHVHSLQEVWPVVKSILPSMVGEVAVAIPLLRRFKPIVQSDENVHAQKRLRTDG